MSADAHESTPVDVRPYLAVFGALLVLTLVTVAASYLDLATAPVLTQHLEAYTDSTGNGHRPRRIVYLLPGLEFMDCAGFRSLFTAVDGCSPENVAIREPSWQVRRLLELLGSDSMVEEAVNR